MKKIIALAVLGAGLVACDPFKDEPGGTPTIKEAFVTGRSYGPIAGVLMDDGSWDLVARPGSVGTSGRMVMFVTNQLLDGTSIETEPADVEGNGGCDPANDWLTVTTDFVLTGGQWYTCYYPSSATPEDGASVFIYYSATAPGRSTAAQPVRAGQAPVGNYTFSGTIKTKGGDDLVIDAALSVGTVTATPSADTTAFGGATVDVVATYQNRTAAETTWTVTAVDANGADVATPGTISDDAGVDTVTYTPPATAPAGAALPITVSITATAHRISSTAHIDVDVP